MKNQTKIEADKNTLESLFKKTISTIKSNTEAVLKHSESDINLEEIIEKQRKTLTESEIEEAIINKDFTRIVTSNLNERVNCNIYLIALHILKIEYNLPKEDYINAWFSQRRAIEAQGYLEGVYDKIIANRSSKAKLGGEAKSIYYKKLIALIDEHIANTPKGNRTNAEYAENITSALLNIEDNKQYLGKREKDDITQIILDKIIEKQKQ